MRNTTLLFLATLAATPFCATYTVAAQAPAEKPRVNAVSSPNSPQSAVDEAKRKALIMPGLPGTAAAATPVAAPRLAQPQAGPDRAAAKPTGPNLAKAPKGPENLLDLPAISETKYAPSKRDPFLSSKAVDTIVRGITQDVEEPSVDPINNLAVIILDYIQQNFEAQGISISRSNRFALVNGLHVTEGDYMAIALDPDVVSRVVNSVENGGERIHVNESYTRIYLLVKTIAPDSIGLELPTFPEPLKIEYHKTFEIVKEEEEEEVVLKAKDLPPESKQGEETVTAPTKEGTFRNLPFLTPPPDKKKKKKKETEKVKTPLRPLIPQAGRGSQRGQIR